MSARNNNGKVCSVEMPAIDVMQSAKFYRERLQGIVQGIGAHAPEITARFLDPAGNLMSLYREPA